MQTPHQPNNSLGKAIEKYLDLINTVVKTEYKRLSFSSHLIELSELVNIAAASVYVIISSRPNIEFTNAYIATAIKWAIRNEFRKRYKWYSCRYVKDSTCEGSEYDDENDELSRNNIREAIYETIFSIEEMAESENPIQLEDNDYTPDKKAEFIELNKALREAMKELSPKEEIVLEMRFYENKKVKQIADELNITSSRVSKIIQTSLDKIKANLKLNDLL